MKKYIFYTLLIFSSFFIFFPIIYTLMASFMTTADIVSGTVFPRVLSIENYKELLKNIPILKFFFNSLSTAISGMILQLLICSSTAYALVFIEFKEKKLIFAMVISAIFVPWEAIFVPNYFTILKLNLLNTKLGIILPFISNGLGIFLMVQQFKTLNKSLVEAAKIDGCNNFHIYSRIVLPLSKGILSTWGVYSFLNIWNMYLWPLMTSTRPESRTIQIGLKMIKSEEGTNFGILMAAVIIVIVPSLLVLFLGQKQLQKGLVSGAVKE
ncbi:carbohydrate ABC transporter permease [uncultured Cetobacterium sp.]|uniref:carbohydrate ABC transporter permease n=1 Tax=uncultured Cetobacterium sp. TaxID=527638 RepID=UPI0026078E34|nr:carbohydrate ABC transporter permease [uncultured Cetobacterium sp.]